MPKADRVLSTPPTSTPISQVDATSRRPFLTQAAGVAAGGTVLALATIRPRRPQPHLHQTRSMRRSSGTKLLQRPTIRP